MLRISFENGEKINDPIRAIMIESATGWDAPQFSMCIETSRYRFALN
jgi:hypothetical protein